MMAIRWQKSDSCWKKAQKYFWELTYEADTLRAGEQKQFVTYSAMI
jgi:hypothetical protein